MTNLPPIILKALAAMGLPPAALPRLRVTMSSMIDEMIDTLDLLDAADEDMEDGHDAESTNEDGEDQEGDELDLGELDLSDLENDGAFITGGIGA